MVKVHVVVEAYKGCIEDVHVYDDSKAAEDKLKAIKADPDFNEDEDDAQLYQDVEVVERVTPRFKVVEFRKDAALNVLFSDKTQEEAANIVHVLNVGMFPSQRAEGCHYEMQPQDTPKTEQSS